MKNAITVLSLLASFFVVSMVLADGPGLGGGYRTVIADGPGLGGGY